MRFISRFYISRAHGVSGKNEQPSQLPWRGAQCNCIGCNRLKIGPGAVHHKLHNYCRRGTLKTASAHCWKNYKNTVQLGLCLCEKVIILPLKCY